MRGWIRRQSAFIDFAGQYLFDQTLAKWLLFALSVFNFMKVMVA
jgi:hypothetical protein